MQTDTSSNPCSMDLLAPGTRARHWRSHPWSCFLFPGGDSTGQRWLCCPGASPHAASPSTSCRPTLLRDLVAAAERNLPEFCLGCFSATFSSPACFKAGICCHRYDSDICSQGLPPRRGAWSRLNPCPSHSAFTLLWIDF